MHVLYCLKEKDLHDPLKTVRIKHIRRPCNYADTKYVEDLSKYEKSKIAAKTFVGIDPGVDDLLFATNGDTKIITKKNGNISHKTTTFRYSRMQRRLETRSRKYAKIIERDKKRTKIKQKSVKEIESKLSSINLKSCILTNVKNNIKLKNETNGKLKEYYEQKMYRRMKLSGYINRERSESKMINRFKKKFGGPKEVAIFIGDWSSQKRMRYKEPTKGKGFRKLFKKKGYDIFLVDEYNTTKKMYESGDEMEQFKYIKKKKKHGQNTGNVLVHGLIRNKLTNNIPDIKTELMNRDLNGSLNIRHKGICLFYDAPIPSYLSRSEKEYDNNINNIDIDIDQYKKTIKYAKRMTKK